ncbi:alpha/beta fold hydrolase [Nakamurella endophytica]|nr:alpha/beta hydrolase [Nakamurella endophytica]
MYSAVHDLILDGRDLRVFSNGTGRPILFLHDLGSSAAAFEQLTRPVVRAGRELVAVDLPGCGHSDPVGTELSGYVDHLVQALPQLAGEPLDLVGHGFGGYLAASVAAARPAEICTLVLSQPLLPPRSGPAMQTRMSPGMAVSGALTTLRRGKLRQNLGGYSRARSALEQLSQTDEIWWEELSRITARTLVLGCAGESAGERALLDQLAAAVPNGMRNTVRGGRRPYADDPEDFAGFVLDWVCT